MHIISKNWNEFSTILDTGLDFIEHINGSEYDLYTEDGYILYHCLIQNSEDKTDYETNYQSNKSIILTKLDEEGRPFIRAESRPLNCTTWFTSRGDTLGETPSIGTGDRLEWDASISEDWTTDGCPSGFKKKEIMIQFVDSIWIKDGTLYYMDVKKGSYIDMEVICPNGGYYMYLGELQQNLTGDDLIVDHYINKMPIQSDVPMGDELNTETCSQELPNYLKYRFTITVPTSDTTSYGYGLFEIYRQRTVII